LRQNNNDCGRYVGASVAAAGPFFEIDVNKTDPDGIQPTNGWPLFDDRISFSTISGLYDVEPGFPLPQTNFPELNDNGWESFISGIPHAPGLIFEWDGNALNASVSNTTILNYDRRIRFETGENKWEYTWSPECEGGPSFNVSFETIFSRAIAQVIATKAEITASEDTDLTVTDLLDGRSAVRSYPNAKGMDPENTIYASVHPNGLPNKTAYVVSGLDVSHQCVDASSRRVAQGSYVSLNESTIGQTYNISLKRGETATFYKYVGVASNDKFPDAESVARQKQASAQACGFEVLLEEHKNAWREIMPRSSIDDFSDPATGELPADPNIEVLQIAAVANPYYLLQNLQPDGSNLNDDSISVGGLASDSYAGLVFWDADYWMAPGLNLAFPRWAKQISNFRIKQYPEALKNAANNSYYTFPNDSALYSWTAGRYGNCTGTGPCINYEYHLNYDIANNLLQEYNVTNDETWFNNGPRQIIESIATSTGELLQYNQTTGSYWLHNMTDPDEFANHVDNGAFTIASAAMLLQNANQIRAAQGLPINEAWQIQAENIAFPKSGSGITKEFEAMNNSVVVKQADVVLLAYPLGFDQNYTAEDKLEDLEYVSSPASSNHCRCIL
jgi:trehalose/maltose hydrolase-like predicted phosphorylase